MQIRPLPEQIAITITQSLSGSISLVGSATIIYRLFRSKTKLASPFTRLLFCLCAGDIILSSTFIASTMPSPPTESVWGSLVLSRHAKFKVFFLLSQSSLLVFIMLHFVLTTSASSNTIYLTVYSARGLNHTFILSPGCGVCQ